MSLPFRWYEHTAPLSDYIFHIRQAIQNGYDEFLANFKTHTGRGK